MWTRTLRVVNCLAVPRMRMALARNFVEGPKLSLRNVEKLSEQELYKLIEETCRNRSLTSET